MSDRPWVLLGAVAGGTAGYYLGGKKILWAAVGVIAGISTVPAIAQAAMPVLPPSQATVHTITLVPGQTIIVRPRVGDILTVLAPSGWGVPSAVANIPGFLEVQSASPTTESSTFKVTEAGRGQIVMQNGGEDATLSIDASA